MLEMLEEGKVMTIRRRLASTGLAALDFGAVEPLHANVLGSAVGRQSTGFGGKSKGESLERVAATLFYGLVQIMPSKWKQANGAGGATSSDRPEQAPPCRHHGRRPLRFGDISG